jgi:hypothetical protein
VTVDQARTHYARILAMIRSERDKRDKFLHGVRREQALREADGAIVSLEAIGDVLKAAADAGVLTEGAQQAPLLDVGNPPVNYR